MSITKVTHSASSVNVPMIVTLTASSQTNMVLAHYNSEATEGNKKLSTGYIDGGSQFHEELDATTFTGKTDFYGTLTIKLEIDFTQEYSSSTNPHTAGWLDSEGNQTYSYANLPTYWKTADDILVPWTDIKAGLETDSVDVGIKQVAATDSSTRGRVFERYAADGDPFYAYYNSTTDVEKSAEGSGALSGYVKTASSVALKTTGGGAYNVTTEQITVKSGLMFYVYGGGTGSQAADASDVPAKFEAKVA